MGDHPNAKLVREAFDLFAQGDIAALRDRISEDSLWHFPGTHPLAGDYRGKDEILGLFIQIVQETGGTFKTTHHDVVGNDEHVVTLSRVYGERNGKTLDQRAVNVFHVDENGSITERWLMLDDPAAADEFWS